MLDFEGRAGARLCAHILHSSPVIEAPCQLNIIECLPLYLVTHLLGIELSEKDSVLPHETLHVTRYGFSVARLVIPEIAADINVLE